jgi:hypothetical protein
MKNMINFYRQMRNLENECRNEIFKILEPLGNAYRFDPTNFSLILDYYNENGEVEQVFIDSLSVGTLPSGEKFLTLNTKDGKTCSLSDFVDCTIIYIYEHLYYELHKE